MEGDVTLKVEVDPDGKVTRAEIIKGAGAGFDKEALKTVKQARFEPAQKDGQNVTAEFILSIDLDCSDKKLVQTRPTGNGSLVIGAAIGCQSV